MSDTIDVNTLRRQLAEQTKLYAKLVEDHAKALAGFREAESKMRECGRTCEGLTLALTLVAPKP
jgi:hypothetical protein